MSPLYEPGRDLAPWYRRPIEGAGGLKPLGIALALVAGFALAVGGCLLAVVLDAL